MQKIFITLTLGLYLLVPTVHGASFKGVSDLVNGAAGPLNDPYVVSSMWQRCSGLFGALVKFHHPHHLTLRP